MEIESVPEDVAEYLRFRMRRSDLMHGVDPKRFPSTGTDYVVTLVRSIAESTNGPAALTVPILSAMSDCAKPLWVNRGSEWLEALDDIKLLELEAGIRELDIADDTSSMLKAAIYRRLHRKLGSPHPPPPPKPKKPKPVKPDHISQEAWDDMVEARNARRRETYRRWREAKSLAAGETAAPRRRNRQSK